MSQYHIQTNYTAGELSPRLSLRVDFDKYQNGVETLENYVVMPHGGVTRAEGTRFVAEVKDSNKSTRLIPFEFSTTQAYMLEFGDLYIRIYKDGGRIESPPGTPVEVVSPYAAADLFDLKYAQSADTLYIVHQGYAPRKLTRTSHTSWTLTPVTFLDGPYLDQNLTAPNTTRQDDWTITPSAFTGTGITLTAGPAPAITNAANNGSGLIRITSAAHGYETGETVFIAGVTGTTEANGTWVITKIDANNYDLQGSTFTNAYAAGGTARPGIWVSTDVGRFVRMLQGAVWGYAKITAFTDVAHVTADVILTLTSTAAKTSWRLGAWSTTTGFPSAVTFFEQRLVFGGSTAQPQTVWASVSSDYEDFTPGTNDDDPFTYTVASNQVNAIVWLASTGGLLIGTVGAEFVLFGGNEEPVTPTNVNVRLQSTRGSLGVSPVNVGTSVLFVQRAGRKIRELIFSEFVVKDNSGAYSTPDLSILAEHITDPFIVEMSYQQEPNSIVWCVRADGVLVAFTYNPEQEVRAFSRRITDGAFESVATIPSPDADGDQTWVIVARNIGGVIKRYVEYMDKALYVDCGLSYSGAAVSSVSGLSHLESRAVDVVGDMAVYPQETVAAGSITLDGPDAEEIQVGLHYTPKLVPLRPEVKVANGDTSQGQKKRWAWLFVRLHESLGLTINGDELQFRSAADPMDEAPPLYTGDKRTTITGWDTDGKFIIRQDQPLPSTILGHFGVLDVGGNGE